MRIRGERECTDCGTRWSYYETGSVGCPGCGSVRSVGLDDRTEHTDLQMTLDLTGVRNAVEDHSIDDLAERASEECREYLRRRGFVNAGDLRDLDDTYLAASELRHVADVVGRSVDIDERDELYFLSLLRDADDGERPPAPEVPPRLHPARGLASATAVRDYRRDVRTWAENRDLTPTERSALEALGEHVTRIRMLDGDVDPGTADRLVEATRDLTDGLRGDEPAISRAQNRLEEFEYNALE